MRRSETVRVATLALAVVHAFPARRHLGAFFLRPGLTEAWEGFGALVAVGLYCLPVAVQVRALTALWRRRRPLLRAGGLLLATVHAVPACDHLPRFFAHGRWYDAWRGVGSAVAVLWFLTPLRLQGKAIAAIARMGHLRPACLESNGPRLDAIPAAGLGGHDDSDRSAFEWRTAGGGDGACDEVRRG